MRYRLICFPERSGPYDCIRLAATVLTSERDTFETVLRVLEALEEF